MMTRRYLIKFILIPTVVVFLWLFVLPSAVHALQFSISGYILDEGSIGDSSSPSAYAQVTFTRDGIAGECVTSLASIYPGNGSTIPASYDRDCGSLEWASTPPAAGQVVTATIEVQNGLNGWTGGDYIAVVSETITNDDMLAADMSMPAANLLPDVPPPPDRIAILNSPADSVAAQNPTTLTVLNIETRNIDGNVSVVTSDTTVNLSSSSSGAISNPKYYSVSGGTCTSTEITDLTILSGNSTAQFCYGDEKTGTHDVTASVTGWFAGYAPSTTQATILPSSLGSFDLNFASPQQNRVAFLGVNTITALDIYGNIKTDFDAGADIVTISSSPAGLTIQGLGGASGNELNQTLDFSNGVADVTGSLEVIATALGDYTFTASANSGSTGTSGLITINAGEHHSFIWDLTSPQKIDTAFTGTNTLRAVDADGHTVTSFDASVNNVSITESLSQGTVSGLGSMGGNILDRSTDFVDGIANFTGSMKYVGTAAGHEFVATSGSTTATSASVDFGSGSVVSYDLSFNSPQANDSWFSSATITARDISDNVVTDYDASSNPVTLSTANGVMSINARANPILNQASDFSNGVADISGLVKYTGAKGSQTITATGDDGSTGETAVEITAGTINSIRINDASGEAGNEFADYSIVAGQSVDLWAGSYDISGNYIGNVNVDWSSTGDMDSVSETGLSNITYTPVNAPRSGTITITDSVLNDATGTITVNPAGLDNFSVTIPGSVTAGVGFTPSSILALDQNGNIVTSYSGTKVLNISGASNGILTGTPTSSITAEFVDGQMISSTNITLVRAETVALTFNDGAVSGVSNETTVSAASIDHFAVLAPSAVTAGQEFSITEIVAEDEFGNSDTSYSGTKTLSYTGPSDGDNGDIPAYTETVSFANGQASTDLLTTLYKKESTQITVSEGGISGASNTIIVSSNNADSIVYHSGNDQTGFVNSYLSDPISVMIVDLYGNPVSGVSVDFIVISGGGNVSNVTVSTGADGLAQTNWQLGSVAGTNNNTLEARALGLSGSPIEFTASATPSSGSVVEITTPLSGIAGVEFLIDLTVTDSSGNTVTSYTGLKTLTFSGPSDSPSGESPVYVSSVEFINGQALSIPVTLYKSETVSLTVDITNDSITGVSSPITIDANSPSVFSLTVPSTATVNVPFDIVDLRTNDAYGNFSIDYNGEKSVSFSGPSNSIQGTEPTFPSTINFSNGVAVTPGSITLQMAESTTIGIQSGGISGISNEITSVFADDFVLFYISGNNQTGAAGVELPDQLVVAVLDKSGNPATSKIVEFNPSSGSASNYTSAVDASGYAYTSWTLGDSMGGHTLIASVIGIPDTITFNANASSGIASRVNIIQTSVQTTIDVPTSPITVCAQDAEGNNALSNQDITLSLSATSSTGSFASSSLFDPEINEIVIEAGTSCVDFVYKDSATGSSMVTVSNATYGSDSLIVTVEEELIPISRIEISPEYFSINSNETKQLTARAFDSDGNVIENIEFLWDINGTNLGAVTQNGVYVPPQRSGVFENAIVVSYGGMSAYATPTVALVENNTNSNTIVERLVEVEKDTGGNNVTIIINKYSSSPQIGNYSLPEVPVILSPLNNTYITRKSDLPISGTAPKNKVLILTNSQGDTIGATTSDNYGYWKMYVSPTRFTEENTYITATIIKTALTSEPVKLRIEKDNPGRNIFNFFNL